MAALSFTADGASQQDHWTLDPWVRDHGPMCVTWISDIGPRVENQDRAMCRVRDDGSWLVGVADGLGGHPRGPEAAEAAISGLPDQIASADEMTAASSTADDKVSKLPSVGIRAIGWVLKAARDMPSSG